MVSSNLLKLSFLARTVSNVGSRLGTRRAKGLEPLSDGGAISEVSEKCVCGPLYLLKRRSEMVYSLISLRV